MKWLVKTEFVGGHGSVYVLEVQTAREAVYKSLMLDGDTFQVVSIRVRRVTDEEGAGLAT